MQKKQSSRVGFALPTVLIASVVMLTVLTVSVTSVVSVRTALLTQYYEQIAKTAGEAGIAYAKACLAKSGNVPLWSDAKPLRPSTDCAGNETVGTSSFSALVVAGGGSGGGSTGGGGGGGGVIDVQDITLANGNYTVSIGAGGAIPGNQAIGRNGANSSFNGLVAIGGGGGSYSAGGTTSAAGLNGGSGGGGQVYHGPRGPGTGTAGQGQDGGSIAGAATTSTTGGGGAGGPGSNSSTVNGGGAGGTGKLSTMSGAALYYGGGGGGAGGVGGTCGAGSGVGGIGGGGNGGDTGSAGQINTGGGGGGGWCYASGNGGAGGSGVVIIRYPNNGSVVASGGNQVFTSGMYKIHKFTAVGNSTFTLTSVSPSSCPTDPRCSVMIDGNLRSSFSIGLPTLDNNGRAVAIPNNGYVDLLRESNGLVWRTYRQPTVQSAVVPDLCSGAATSSLGWSRAVETTAQNPLPTTSTARTISQLNAPVPAGMTYFRKDFPVTSDGTYSVVASTPSSSDKVNIYVDGVLQVTAQGAVSTNPIVLSAGCHTITAQLDNVTVVSRPSQFIAAIQKDGATTPVVATNSEWRVSSGMAVHYSSPEFDADPSIWLPVIDYNNPTALSANANWQNVQSDIFTRIISPSTNGCMMTCPASSSTYLRDSRDFVLAANTEVVVSAICDDNCSIYIDGQEVLSSGALWSSIGQQTLTLSQGVHRVGMKLYNGGSATNPSGGGVSITVKTAVPGLPVGTVLARTDRSWSAANVWTSGAGSADVFSYEKSFTPSPDEITRPVTYDLLVVGGGGGGGSNSAGGGGGGGLIYRPDLQLAIGTYNVIVGAGGAGAANSSTTGSNGGGSSFGSYSVSGGGAGASRDNGNGGVNGASGGGGSGPTSGGTNPSLRHIGGNGINGQGFAGGSGTPADQSYDSKGGGGGGAGGSGGNGVNAVAGNGGAGFITFLTGSRLGFAGGGGGANTAGYGSLGVGTDGGTNGNSSAAGANTGGGGGGNSGAGGSGTVIIRVKTGSAVITTTGSPVVSSNVVIGGISYTIYKFNANGTFRIVSVN